MSKNSSSASDVGYDAGLDDRADEWIDIVADVSVEDVKSAEAALIMTTSAGIYSEDYSELDSDVAMITRANLIEDELAGRDRTRARVHVYAEPGHCVEALIDDIKSRLLIANVDARVTANGLREEDWANNWKKYFKPIRIGSSIVVIPAWENIGDAKTVEGDTVVYIDPGMAFGTGSHSTTKMCMELLEKRRNDGLSIKRALDAGTGSGILAITSILMGADAATGVDIDVNALKNARQNAELNGVNNKITLIEGDLLKKVDGSFDIIFANIVADAVVELLGDASRLLAPDGSIIVSGIIDEREEEVLCALSRNGLRVRRILRETPWVAIEAVY